jgi:hypothetical protein
LTEAEQAYALGIDSVGVDRARDAFGHEIETAPELLGVGLAPVEAAVREVEFVPGVPAHQPIGRAQAHDEQLLGKPLGDRQ